MMLQDVQLPFNPTSDRIIGYVDILDDMHFEMDFVIHSWPSGTWASVFKCGPGEDNRQRYPGLWLHRDREGLLVQVMDEDAVVGGMRADSLALDTAHHVEVDFTQNWFTMVLNGETLYDDAKDFEHTVRHHVPCWASALWKDVADVTITNLVLSSHSTLFPTPSPSMLIRSVHFGIVIFLHSVFPDPLHSVSVFPAESVWKCLEMTASAPLSICPEMLAAEM